jgi:hypothetical protein
MGAGISATFTFSKAGSVTALGVSLTTGSGNGLRASSMAGSVSITGVGAVLTARFVGFLAFFFVALM